MNVRFFQGFQTNQVDDNGKPAIRVCWHYEPTDYEGDVLWSKPYNSRQDAEDDAEFEANEDEDDATQEQVAASVATVKIRYAGERVTLTWEPAQASAPIRVDGASTGYQTADARHGTRNAVQIACQYTWPEVFGTLSVGDDWDGVPAWDDVSYETL